MKTALGFVVLCSNRWLKIEVTARENSVFPLRQRQGYRGLLPVPLHPNEFRAVAKQPQVSSYTSLVTWGRPPKPIVSARLVKLEEHLGLFFNKVRRSGGGIVHRRNVISIPPWWKYYLGFSNTKRLGISLEKFNRTSWDLQPPRRETRQETNRM